MSAVPATPPKDAGAVSGSGETTGGDGRADEAGRREARFLRFLVDLASLISHSPPPESEETGTRPRCSDSWRRDSSEDEPGDKERVEEGEDDGEAAAAVVDACRGARRGGAM